MFNNEEFTEGLDFEYAQDIASIEYYDADAVPLRWWMPPESALLK